MLLMIDNYDSFTYNLVQYFGELGQQVEVVRNDALDVAGIAALKPERIVISPGPCTPDEAGVSLAVLAQLSGSVPILGVCLGHQSLGQAFGGEVVRAETIMHGKTSPVHHDGKGVFAGLPSPFEATRYHSLVVERESLPDCLEVTAWTRTSRAASTRSWACATAACRSKACSSTPSPSSPSTATTCCATSLPPAPAPATPRRPEVAFSAQDALARVIVHREIFFDEMVELMRQVMRGEVSPVLIAALLVGLRVKKETVGEIAGAATVMREFASKVEVADRTHLVDIVGTGGDGAHTFNISTACMFVCAAAGARVAKHGNRSVSSKSGSADVLEALGALIELPPAQVARCIAETGIGFMFAPHASSGDEAMSRRCARNWACAPCSTSSAR